jgi:predicted GNAT superfamily acetyltransferase
MYWTYDPLVARNAHLNLEVLGARAAEYVEDMYGESRSELHRGLGTDRFVVAWALDRAHARRTPDPPDDAARTAPLLNDDPGAVLAAAPALARIEIPADIHRVREESPPEAVRWRQATRRAFLAALAHGYEVARFIRDPGQGRGWYVLARTEDRGPRMED